MADLFLSGLGIYLGVGFVFAIPFVVLGARHIDPAASGGSWGFKVVSIPGSAIFWPLLMVRWVRGRQPTEDSAHRRAATKQS
jgi:hypothetical protein